MKSIGDKILAFSIAALALFFMVKLNEDSSSTPEYKGDNSQIMIVNTNGVASGLKLREAPTTSSNIITSIPNGAEVKLDSSSPSSWDGNNNWVYISYQGQEGWCCQSQNVNDKNITYLTEKANTENIQNPKVCIYCSHYEEEYNSYTIPNVRAASKILAEKLNSMNIKTITPPESIYSWSYSDSYSSSGQYLQEQFNNNSSLKYAIDVHRDSVSKIIEINGIKYAKMTLVVGTDNREYETSLNFATDIKTKMDSLYPGLIDIRTQGGAGNNGIYNQNLGNVLLVEIGGDKSSENEIYNSINALALTLREYIEEKNKSSFIQNRAIDPIYEFFDKLDKSLDKDNANPYLVKLVSELAKYKDYDYENRIYEELGEWIMIEENGDKFVYFKDKTNELIPILYIRKGYITSNSKDVELLLRQGEQSTANQQLAKPYTRVLKPKPN